MVSARQMASAPSSRGPLGSSTRSTGRDGATIPQRLDRLPWSRFHWRVVIALGITWVLDGLEVTLVGALSGAIHASPALGMNEARIGLAGSAYLLGAVGGALLFGWLTDVLGRRRIFFITLMLYIAGAIATGLAWDFWSFAAFRCLTGLGIGGEYAAVNSAIQELVPARRRGVVDLCVNGTFWAGAALGAGSALFVLDPAHVNPELGWRAAFVVGGVLALLVLLLRRNIPESPRWLALHGRQTEAEAVIRQIEREAEAQHGPLPALPAPTGGATAKPGQALMARPTLGQVAGVMLGSHRRRSLLGLVLMACQAFCYNAVFFTYALVLTRFYGVPAAQIGWYMLPFALGNFLGPVLLGPFFDSIGRKPMICLTYATAGLLLAATGHAFLMGWLSAWEQTIAWTVIFFFASAAASAAYLTVGESFPLPLRAMAIALFYAFGTAIGGVVGPALFGALIATGERLPIVLGFWGAAALMLLAAFTEYRLGFAAEGKPLEEASSV